MSFAMSDVEDIPEEDEEDDDEGGGGDEERISETSEGLEKRAASDTGAGDSASEPEPEPEEVLTVEEASRALCLVGRAADGLRYAYLKLSAVGLHLCDVSAAARFQHLLFIDVSRNRLRDGSLDCLAAIRYLVTLKAEDNLLHSAALPIMPYLQLLSLSGNRILDTHGINHPLLECLELNRNWISHVCDLDPVILKRLRTLEMRQNKLTSTGGIAFPSLENLYLAENSITQLLDLPMLHNLRILHLRQNPISSLVGISSKMKRLTYLNLRACKIDSMDELRKLILLHNLETLVILENPLLEQLEEEYRVVLLSHVPRLKRIDKQPVEEEEVEAAEELATARLQDEQNAEEESQELDDLNEED